MDEGLMKIVKGWKKVPSGDMERRMKEAFARKKEKLDDLKSRSKPLHELVVSEKFLIEGVLGKSYATSVTPSSEMRFGGHSPSYDSGYTTNITLQVIPEKVIHVKNIHFDGFFPGRAGDRICARIPKYTEEKYFPEGRIFGFESLEGGTFYFDREFKPQESAIELSLLSSDDRVLGIYRSVDYDDFFKEED